MEVEFDPLKAKSNLKKHSVSFEEAITALLDERANWIEDPDSLGENRWVLRGLSSRDNLLTVVITLRWDRFRVISARKATKTEARYYAKRI